MGFIQTYKQSLIAFAFILFLLIPVHMVIERPMLLMERFLPGWGWIEILLLGFYGAFVTHKMIHAHNTAKWRLRIWTLFSFVFFGQLLLGLFGMEQFLMTGQLHFPIPAMIVAGPIYRFQIGFMPILFLSTIVLSGPAWCSQLCYFGAIDGLLASNGRPSIIKNKHFIRLSIFFAVLLGALFFRLFQLNESWVIWIIAGFGIIGLSVILFMSRRKGAMVHCTSYCPVGVAVSYLKFVNPFRLEIGNECTFCQKCVRDCRYDALSMEDLKSGKPGISCTYCGDCISACSSSQIRYKLFRFKPQTARMIWIVMTVVLHTVFLGLARI
mgnify:FL=1